jgi:hypothetical protein
MIDWTQTLSAIDLDGIKPVFPEATHATDAAVGLDAERSFRRSGTHTARNAAGVSRAAEVLDRLPHEGESIHVILRGGFRNWDFVPAILRMAAPARATDLWLATLGYDQGTGEGLLRLLDAGQVGTCTLLASCYFQAHEKTLWGWLTAELERRGSRALAARNHAKLMLFRMSDGRHFTMESSGNLRSCRNTEQASLTADKGLFDFHAGWIDELFRKAQR